MGTCRYCGESAGLFSRQHDECSQRRQIALDKLPEFFVKLLDADCTPQRFAEMAQAVAAENYIAESELREIAAAGLAAMVGKALDDDMITADEERRIATVAGCFNIGSDHAVFSGPAFKLKKAAILRDLDVGKLPEGITIDTGPLILDPDEAPVWLFNGVERLQLRTRTRYVGGSHGVSLRIMKGVYYRVGAFKGEPVRTEEFQSVGTGALLITSENLTFIASPGATKIPLRKIMMIEPYTDAIAVTREGGANPKPNVFKLDDPWFAANTITRLVSMD
jgi:hypothetical protein